MPAINAVDTLLEWWLADVRHQFGDDWSDPTPQRAPRSAHRSLRAGRGRRVALGAGHRGRRLAAGMARSPHPHALLAAAVEAISEAGPAEVSLRDLARRVGVSHAAPAHHFGDKAGLLTALAAEGYQLLADTLRDAWQHRHSYLEVGVAYVGFAVTHTAHFQVMFSPDL